MQSIYYIYTDVKYILHIFFIFCKKLLFFTKKQGPKALLMFLLFVYYPVHQIHIHVLSHVFCEKIVLLIFVGNPVKSADL